MEYKLHNGSGGLCCKGCSRQDKKLNTCLLYTSDAADEL